MPEADGEFAIFELEDAGAAGELAEDGVVVAAVVVAKAELFEQAAEGVAGDDADGVHDGFGAGVGADEAGGDEEAQPGVVANDDVELGVQVVTLGFEGGDLGFGFDKASLECGGGALLLGSDFLGIQSLRDEFIEVADLAQFQIF